MVADYRTEEVSSSQLSAFQFPAPNSQLSNFQLPTPSFPISSSQLPAFQFPAPNSQLSSFQLPTPSFPVSSSQLPNNKFSCNLDNFHPKQRIHFPTHDDGHTFDLLITRTSSDIIPHLSHHKSYQSDLKSFTLKFFFTHSSYNSTHCHSIPFFWNHRPWQF